MQVHRRYNEDSTDWQYVSAKIKTGGAYKSITVYALYYGNENSVEFDGLQLYKEEFGTSYQYDANNNLKGITDVNGENSSIEYDSNNEVVKTTSESGNISTNEYDVNNVHNLKTKTSPENVTNTFTYDGFGNPTTNTLKGISATDPFIQSKSIYTANGNYLKSVEDPSGNTVNFNYNEIKGTVDSITDSKSNTVVNPYDEMDSLIGNYSVAPSSSLEIFPLNGATIGTKGTKPVSDSAVYAKDENGKTVLSVNGGTKTLYNLGLSKTAGTMSAWTKSTGSSTTRYLFAAQGSNSELLCVYIDTANKVNAAVRDTLGAWKTVVTSTATISTTAWNFIALEWKVVAGGLQCILYLNANSYVNTAASYKDFTGTQASIGSFIDGNYAVNDLDYTTSYTYDSENKPKTTTYEFEAGKDASPTNKSTTNRVSKIINNGKGIIYSYDNNGNIETITENGKVITYYYNELNELTRENNQVLNKTITYSYDNGGNILNKGEYAYTAGTPGAATKTYAYAYGDANWKDKLTFFDGKAITYDAIGNPLDYDGYTYTWEQGRQLAGMTGNGKTITYKYNDSGIRTQKTVNGVTTTYHLVGDKVTYEDNGTDKIHYTYDGSDTLVSMNLNGVEYYYIRNAQSDIIGLHDSAGVEVVSYSYDSWGKLISTTGTHSSTVGVKNPYRYRGYRYDTETSLYYLQSRYYNAEWGRFVNGDNTSMLQVLQDKPLGVNLFAYCGNNPVNDTDPSGYMSIKTLGKIIDYMIFAANMGGAFMALKAGLKLAKFISKEAIKLTKKNIIKALKPMAATVGQVIFGFGININYSAADFVINMFFNMSMGYAIASAIYKFVPQSHRILSK